MRYATILSVLACLGMTSAAGATVHQVTVVDGDTVTIATQGMATGLRLRALGFDAPEANSSCAAERSLAKRAKDRVVALSVRGLDVTTGLQTDMYGRILATLRTPNGQDVGQILIGEGLARPFDGKTARRPWCDASGRVVP
jgi:micrococcal nuclease